MTLSSDRYPPSIILAIAVTSLYALWFLVRIRRARHAASLLPLLMPPLLCTAFGAWVALARVVQGARLSGAGRASTAAGFADAMTVTGFGGIVTTICTVIALIAVARGPNDAIGSYPRPPIVIAALCWLVSGAAFAIPGVFSPAFALWNVCLIAAFLSLALLIPVAVIANLASRRNVARRNQLLALGITALLAILQAAAAWSLVNRFRLTAILG
jgi:hypothetical protein